MNRIRRYMLPLAATVLSLGLGAGVAQADNPLVRPAWSSGSLNSNYAGLPKAGAAGNAGGTDCNPALLDDDTKLQFGDCFNQSTLMLRLTGDDGTLGSHPQGSLMRFLEDVVGAKLLRAEDNSNNPTPLFANFLDLTLKRFLDADTSTTIDYDATSFLYLPVTGANGVPTGRGGYEASPFLDRTCLDIPLVGSVCMHMYLFDVDNEAGAKFISYDYDNASFTVMPAANDDVESGNMDELTGVCDPSINGANTPCGALGNLAAEYRDDDDGLQIQLQLNDVVADVLFEPPAEFSLTDVSNSSTDYVPADDLSTYLKAYGKLELGTIQLTLNIRVASSFNGDVQPHAVALGFELQNVDFQSNFQFVFNKGPYCNNNLGTTESNPGDPYRYNEDVRPFRDDGSPNYPNLVSDITGGGLILTDYFARKHGDWAASPVTTVGITTANVVAPALHGNGAYTGATGQDYYAGGTGQGRDRIGVNSHPYQFEEFGGEWYLSDNPNNCRRPADACTNTNAGYGPLQDGGVEYGGVTGSCEYPNRSDNGDDSTYKISEQITSIIPYIQGEINATAEDKFKNRARGNPGYYLGPTSLLDLGATLAGISFDWPLRPGTDYVFLDILLDSDVDGDSTNEFWADQWGVMMPFNFALGVSWNSVPAITAPVSQRLDTTACVQSLGALTGYVDGIGEFVANADQADDPFLTKPIAPKALQALTAGAAQQGLLAGFNFPAVTWPTITPAAAEVTPDTGAYGVGLALHQNVLSAALYDAVLKGLLCADLDATGQLAPVTDQVLGETTADLLNTSTFELFFPALAKDFPNRPMRMRVIPLLQKYVHGNTCGAGGANPSADCGVGFDQVTPVTDVVNTFDHLQEDASAPYIIMGGPPINLALSGVTTYPDFTVVIPNLLIEFYVYGTSDSDNTWYRVFAIDMGVAIGLNIDILKQPTPMGAGLDTLVNTDTYFPIGCDPTAGAGQPNECTGNSAPTRRVLRLAGIADPEINAIIEYSELSLGNIDDPASGSVDDAWNDYQVLKGAISNLIGVALSVDVDLLAEIGFDIGAFLNLPLVFDAPYIGTSFVNDGAGNNATDNELPAGNGFGDYLVAGLSLDLSYLDSAYLIGQLDYLLDGTSATQPFGLDLDIGLAPKAGSTSLSVPQAVIDGPVKVSAAETVFRFSGFDSVDGDNLQYSWRVDNGVWSVFDKSTEARIQGLLEGKHTFEVKALNSQSVLQPEAARYTFVVDSIAPKVRVLGDRTVGNRANFFVEAEDWLTSKEDLRVAYRLNDGSWSNFGYNQKISLSGLSSGRHTLRVKVADNAGNIAESAFNFTASDGGFGCSTTGNGAGSMADALVLLAIPALVLLRKRLF